MLASRGISVLAVAAAATPKSETPLEQQISLARDLWASGISKCGQFLCMAAFLGLASFPAKLVPHFGSDPTPALISSLLVGAVTFGMGYAGYRIGRYFTREICANGDRPVSQRRNGLRLFAASVIPTYLLVYVLLSALLPR